MTVTFPDSVALIIDYLNAGITPPVHHKIPNPRPATFVTVQRTGGPKRNLVTDEPQVTVEAWAATDVAAHDLAQTVRALLNDLGDNVRSLDGVPVYRCEEISGPVDLPDPLSDQPRFSQSFSIALRGS